MFKHILVPHDGSELSHRTAAAAVQFAKTVGARITTLYAQEEPSSTDYTRFNANAMSPEQFRADEGSKARSIAAAVEEMAKAAGVPYGSATMSGGAPYEAIIKTAQDQGCDLIFMASHGRRGISALVLGSETNKVLTYCKIPVMVYR